MKFNLKARFISVVIMPVSMILIIIFMHGFMYPILDTGKPYKILVEGKEVMADSISGLRQEVESMFPSSFTVDLYDETTNVVAQLDFTLGDIYASYISPDDRNQLRMYFEPDMSNLFLRKATATIDSEGIDTIRAKMRNNEYMDVLVYVKDAFIYSDAHVFSITRDQVYYDRSDIENWAIKSLAHAQANNSNIVTNPQQLTNSVISILKGI